MDGALATALPVTNVHQRRFDRGKGRSFVECGPSAHKLGSPRMSDTTRTVLIALGVALLVVVLAPLLFMSGMMGTMMGGGFWLIGAMVLLVLVAGAVLLTVGVARRP